MRKIAVLLSILTAYVAAEETSCWSEPKYPCCSNVSKIEVVDENGFWYYNYY